MLPASITVRTVLAAAFCVLAGGCFAPNGALDASATATESSSSSSTENATGSGTSMGPGATVTGTETETGTDPSSGAGEASTSTSSGSDPDTSGSSGAGAECGDGEVQPGEDCDEGDGNGAGSSCTEACTNNVCGDALIAGDELCDDGEDNGTGDGECAPDCSTTVQTKVIRLNITAATDMDGNMGGADAPSMLDAGCVDSGLPGYRAMFADGVARRASITPNAGDGQIDWVLQPWTRYVNTLGGLIWVTNEIALLGVDSGASVPLMAPIETAGFGVGSVVTGLQQNWVAQGDSMCLGNSSSSPGNFRPTADPGATVNGGYIDDNAGAVNCMVALKYYCVEQ